MAWPTGQEYSDAIQDPRLAFGDLELKAGLVETNHLGLPKPRSGTFAVVYKVDCGHRSWAVKCFTREVPDHQRRYEAISAYLRRVTISYMVGFDYLVRGIRVKGQWFPALKMEWVSGDPLIRFIESRLRDPNSIRNLAGRWVAMTRALRDARVAHGDLQHGNVMVVGGDLKLVDYDGMFVPALSGAPAADSGHPNYQHPGRARLPFGPDLDNFSAWCIYVSLVALSIDPSLWVRLKAGDDCLLFRAGDLSAPDRSQALKAFAASRDEGVNSLGELFGELLRLKAEQIPPLEPGRIHIAPVSVPQSDRGAEWLDDHVKAANPAMTTPTPSDEVEVIDASWVLDFLAPAAVPADARFVHEILWLRLCLAVSVLIGVGAYLLLPAFAMSAIIMTILIVIDLALMWGSYSNEPALGSLEAARSLLAEVDGRCQTATAEVERTEVEHRQRATQRDRDVASVEARIRGTEDKAAREIDGVRRKLDSECAETQKRRQQINSEEKRSLAMVASTLGARAAGLRNEIHVIAQEEATEATRALRDLQSAYVRNALSSATVAGAQIQGLGPQLRGTLVSHGITSAQDVDRWKIHRIRGFGPARVSAVLAWASGVEQRARASMPQTLSVAQTQGIRANYTSRRQTLGAELQRVETQQRSEETSIRARLATMRQEIDDLEARPRKAAARETQTIQENRDRTTSTLQAERAHVAAAAGHDLVTIGEKVARLKRASVNLQWEKSRASKRPLCQYE